jgi:hypothetical protein
LEKEKSY